MRTVGSPLLCVLFGGIGTVGAMDKLCGVGTNLLDHNDAAMTTMCNSNIGFWWNWNYAPRMDYTAACAASTFVPMIWGSAPDNGGKAAQAGKFASLMGYNEPDHWGPPQYPGGLYLSAGSFTANFHCGDAGLAANWQTIVQEFLKAQPGGVVISPSLADVLGTGSAGDNGDCNTAMQTDADHMDECAGWLKCFKESVIKLQCGATNCWDVISVIQFHGYYYDASVLIKKIKAWETSWTEDLEGQNGRSKKTLMLTEFARAGTTDSGDPDGLCRKFMEESVGYMKASPYFSGWSWFGQTNTTFHSFKIDGVKATTDYWASELTDAAGKLTAIGQKYASLCSDLQPVAVSSLESNSLTLFLDRAGNIYEQNRWAPVVVGVGFMLMALSIARLFWTSRMIGSPSGAYKGLSRAFEPALMSRPSGEPYSPRLDLLSIDSPSSRAIYA